MFVVASLRAPSVARGSLRLSISAAAVALGLFTLSWERLANVPVGPFNLKISVVLFAISVLLDARSVPRALLRIGRAGTTQRVLLTLFALVLLWFVVRASVAMPIGPAAAQVLSALSGAVLPAFAVLSVVSRRADLVWALRWLVAGAIVASIFGLYQLAAFYLDLPQGVTYTGLGAGGGAGRISAFNYEPAYFAYFLILVIGAVAALARLDKRPVRWFVLVFFSMVLALVNVRALLFVVPAVVALLAVDWRSNRRLLWRGAVAAIVGCALALLAATSVAAAGSAGQPAAGSEGAPQHRSVPDSTVSGSAEDEASSAPTVGADPLPRRVLDPTEESSNGPRLDLYRAVLRVDTSHLLVGVGPGGLRDALAADGYEAPNQGGVVVANNIWLQAGADGGLVLVVLELAALGSVCFIWWIARRRPEQPLLATLLAVLIIGGMLTSYFFDMKVWVVLALALSASALPDHDD